MGIFTWISDHFIEIFGAVTGVIYVFLEIRQNLWLWPVGIATSATYIWVFMHGKLYADMSLQIYYLAVSVLGWFWWLKGRKGNDSSSERRIFVVHRVKLKPAMALAVVFICLYFVMWFILSRFTDSPVPAFDSFITSLSIVATWMLARKIFEHWYLWIIVNSSAAILFFTRGLYPTVILYVVYCIMSFAGLVEWRKSLVSK